jgi:hypothetical protein
VPVKIQATLKSCRVKKNPSDLEQHTGMPLRIDDPFDSIESAHSFLMLLRDSVEEARRELETDLQRASDSSAHAVWTHCASPPTTWKSSNST